jgi:hypothetical protein
LRNVKGRYDDLVFAVTKWNGRLARAWHG